MSVTESVADAALVASDQVYDQPAKRSALAPRLGNSPYFKPTLGGYPTVAEVISLCEVGCRFSSLPTGYRILSPWIGSCELVKRGGTVYR